MSVLKHVSEVLLALAFVGSGGCSEDSPRTEGEPDQHSKVGVRWTASVVPLTREHLNEMILHWKGTRPGLSLPPEETSQRVDGSDSSNNQRLQATYLPPALRGMFRCKSDASFLLSSSFRTELSWIVSRTNNCRYCLAHQETQLAVLGFTADQIAALDYDWAEFTEAESVAFAFARRLAYSPDTVGPADLERLITHFGESQALELIFVVADVCAANRWTETLAIPSEGDCASHTQVGDSENVASDNIKRPISEKYRNRVSKVAPLGGRETPQYGLCRAVESPRPNWETRIEVEAKLAECRNRLPRFALADEDLARMIIPADESKAPMTQWLRLLVNFADAGKLYIQYLRAIETEGKISPRLKGQIAWIAARHDRAWYAVGHAKRRLNALGLSDDMIFGLDSQWNDYTPGERAVFALARKVTIEPASIEDDDVTEVRKYYSDCETAEIIYHIAMAAFFDRVTEMCGLRLEVGP